MEQYIYWKDNEEVKGKESLVGIKINGEYMKNLQIFQVDIKGQTKCDLWLVTP